MIKRGPSRRWTCRGQDREERGRQSLRCLDRSSRRRGTAMSRRSRTCRHENPFRCVRVETACQFSHYFSLVACHGISESRYTQRRRRRHRPGFAAARCSTLLPLLNKWDLTARTTRNKKKAPEGEKKLTRPRCQASTHQDRQTKHKSRSILPNDASIGSTERHAKALHQIPHQQTHRTACMR